MMWINRAMRVYGGLNKVQAIKPETKTEAPISIST